MAKSKTTTPRKGKGSSPKSPKTSKSSKPATSTSSKATPKAATSSAPKSLRGHKQMTAAQLTKYLGSSDISVAISLKSLVDAKNAQKGDTALAELNSI